MVGTAVLPAHTGPHLVGRVSGVSVTVYNGDPGTSPRLPMFLSCTLRDVTLSDHLWNGTTDRDGYFTGTCVPAPDEPDETIP
jgi:hypothetical protein